MILTGREIKALRGALMHHAHIPFVRGVKAALTAEEQRIVDHADARLIRARESLTASSPRDTPGWLEQLLGGEADVAFTPAEAALVGRLTRASLDEFDDDGDLSALVGPGVGLAALRSAHFKLNDSRQVPS
jgi:hypothetical protein